MSVKGRAKQIAIKCAVTIFWIAVWWGISAIVGKEVLIPSPFSVIVRLSQLAVTSTFWETAASSLLRVALGFFSACVLGVLASVAMHFSKLLDNLLSPLLKIIAATPVASFIILALVWIRSAMLPSFIAFLMVLPVVCGNVRQGLAKTPVQLLEMAQVFEMPRRKVITAIYIPSVVPYLLAASRTGLSLAWKAGVAAEVIAMTAGSIGLKLSQSKSYLETTDLFAWTAVIILLSAVLEKLLLKLCEYILARSNLVAPGGDVNAD